MFNQQLKQTYIAPDIMADMHRWKNLFLTEIGIPNANYEKSERLITNEVNANNTETETLMSMYVDSIRKAFKQANDKYSGYMGVKLSVQWRSTPGENDNVNSETYAKRTN